MVYAQPSIYPGKCDKQTPLGFCHTNGSPNLGQTTRPYNNQQKKRSWRIVDFAVPTDYWVKLKEREKKDKYQDLTWELIKLWNIKVTIIAIVIGTFGTVTKGLLKKLEDLEIRRRMETIQTTSARILRRVLEIWGNLLSLKLQWETIGYH